MTTDTNGAGGWLPNELGFEQWYVTTSFDYPLGSRDCSVARKAWHAALEAARNGELCRATREGDGEVEFFTAPKDMHPETVNLIARFASALAEKLAEAERKYGWDTHWKSPAWMDQCREQLVEHVAKGDPRDVAAYCAFLWHHGEPTALRTLSRVAVQEGMVLVNRAEAVELLAETIYDQWKFDKNYVPWVPGGNSDKQHAARDIARAFMSTAEVAAAQRQEGGSNG